jgi:hypothetical protein
MNFIFLGDYSDLNFNEQIYSKWHSYPVSRQFLKSFYNIIGVVIGSLQSFAKNVVHFPFAGSIISKTKCFLQSMFPCLARQYRLFKIAVGKQSRTVKSRLFEQSSVFGDGTDVRNGYEHSNRMRLSWNKILSTSSIGNSSDGSVIFPDRILLKAVTASNETNSFWKTYKYLVESRDCTPVKHNRVGIYEKGDYNQ